MATSKPWTSYMVLPLQILSCAMIPTLPHWLDEVLFSSSQKYFLLFPRMIEGLHLAMILLEAELLDYLAAAKTAKIPAFIN